MNIRHASISDLDMMLSILSHAREFMKANGNPDQWGDTWPSEEIIRQDIEKGNAYVVVEDNKIIATFALIFGVDPTYLEIRDGSWISDKPYMTIHRLASSMEYKGVFTFIIDDLKKYNTNIRIDTHKDNIPMIRQIEKNGFIYCGVISPIEGGKRVAYEKISIN